MKECVKGEEKEAIECGPKASLCG